MKNGLKAIGKSMVYFAVYLLTQIAVSIVFAIGLTARLTMELMAAGEELDTNQMMLQVSEEIINQAMLMTFIAGVITLFIYWIVFLIRKKKFKKEVYIHSIPVKAVVPIALMASSFNVITSVIISLIPWPQSWMDSYATSSSAIDSSLMAWLTAVLMAPVLEEVVFRGLVYTRLKKGLGVIVAAIITSLIFGIAHGTIIWFIYTFIFSIVLIWIFEKFQSLTASILLHLAYNLSGMALALIPEEAGIVVLILCALSIAGIYFAHKMVTDITREITGSSEVLCDDRKTNLEEKETL